MRGRLLSRLAFIGVSMGSLASAEPGLTLFNDCKNDSPLEIFNWNIPGIGTIFRIYEPNLSFLCGTINWNIQDFFSSLNFLFAET